MPERDFAGTPYVPVYVMLPVSLCTFNLQICYSVLLNSTLCPYVGLILIEKSKFFFLLRPEARNHCLVLLAKKLKRITFSGVLSSH